MTVRPKPYEPGRRSRSERSGSAPQVVRAIEPFERFYTREYRSVVGLAYALSGSRSSSEDLAQEAFVAAHRNWDKIGGYDKPEAWVRRVVANLSVSRFRRHRSEAKAIIRLSGFRNDDVVLPELPAEAESFWAEVRRLPKRQAQCIALHYLEDRPVAEIADILGCSASTVKVHLHKGRHTLASRLGVAEGDDV